MTSAELLKPGEVFAGRYRVHRMLAAGGMGAVFVAEHTGTEDRVAVKVLWPNILQSESARKTFELEARVAARVRSENVVRVLDAGYDDATRMPFLVMELLEGESLAELVDGKGPLAPSFVVQLVTQVAAGLDKAHGFVDKDGAPKPIVHRDLKPENLFLTHRESGEPLVKILDFGLAKVASDATQSREVKGTPLYMASEQAAGRPVSPQTDVWALGLVAFYLLTGRSFWLAASSPDGNVTSLIGEIAMNPIPTPTVRARELGFEPAWTEGFDGWFARCVNREASMRFVSAGEAARHLGGVLRGEVALVAHRGAGVPAMSGRTEASLSASGAGSPKSGRAPVLLGVAGVLAAGGVAGYLLLRKPAEPEPPRAPVAAPPASSVEKPAASAAEPVVAPAVSSDAPAGVPVASASAKREPPKPKAGAGAGAGAPPAPPPPAKPAAPDLGKAMDGRR